MADTDITIEAADPLAEDEGKQGEDITYIGSTEPSSGLKGGPLLTDRDLAEEVVQYARACGFEDDVLRVRLGHLEGHVDHWWWELHKQDEEKGGDKRVSPTSGRLHLIHGSLLMQGEIHVIRNPHTGFITDRVMRVAGVHELELAGA